MHKVAIVEDDQDLRALLIRQLKGCRSLKCCGDFASAEEALRKLPHLNPAIVLMDIKLPEIDGIECTRQLKKNLPDLHVVMLTEFEDDLRIFEALKAGAQGYLLRKQTTPDQMETALGEVMSGGSPMTPQIARKVVAYFQHLEKAQGLEKLTSREKQVLECLSNGWFYKEIADRLGISLDTARNHLRSIYRKLQVTSRTEAVVKYLKTK